MVRGEHRGIPCEDGLDGGIGVELVSHECPDRVPVPATGVGEVAIEGEVPVVEGPGLEAGRFGARHGQVEQGDVNEVDPVCARGDEVPGPEGGLAVFRRRAEKDVEKDADPCLGEIPEGAIDLVEAGALPEGVEDPLIGRLEPELQHGAARGGEAPAEVRIGQERGKPGESVPGNPGRRCRQSAEVQRGDLGVREMEEAGSVACDEGADFLDRGADPGTHVAAALRRLGTEAAALPGAAGGEVVAGRC